MRRGERGFTLIEVLVALLITIIGLAGVRMSQAASSKANRQNGEFTRASMIAEETIEAARGTTMASLLAGATYQPQTFNGVTYSISMTAVPLATATNIVLLTVAVTYSEDNDTTAVDDRTVRYQVLATQTETM